MALRLMLSTGIAPEGPHIGDMDVALSCVLSESVARKPASTNAGEVPRSTAPKIDAVKSSHPMSLQPGIEGVA